jgi:integrase
MAALRKKSGRYYARFYDKRRSPKRKELALGCTRKDVARRRLHDLERRFRDGAFDPWNPDHSAERLSVTETIDRFLEARSHLRQSTLDNNETMLSAWVRDCLPAGLAVRSLDAQHLNPYVHDETVASATQDKRYRLLNTFLGWTDETGLTDGNPLDDVRRPKKKKKQPAFLSPDDLEKLLRCIDAHAELLSDQPGPNSDDEWLKAMIRVAVCTGLRRGELQRLRWRDVDLRQRLLTVRSRDGAETKTGDERQLPLRGDALDVLTRLNNERTDALAGGPVFTDRNDNPIKLDRISKRFKFHIRKAKLADRERLHFHSLRHTCGSWLAMKGVPQRVIQGILGHTEASSTEVYTHLQPEVMGEALEQTFG